MRDFYTAHRAEDGRTQTVQEHLDGTARLAAMFAAEFGCRNQGKLLGLAHDIGKRSYDFYEHLKGGPATDHVSAGMVECAQMEMEWAAECIAGHHGGLPDLGNVRTDGEDAPTLCGRVRRAEKPGGMPFYQRPVNLGFVSAPEGYGQNALSDSFFIRMLFSCLVDADYLDTEEFLANAPLRRTKEELFYGLRSAAEAAAGTSARADMLAQAVRQLLAEQKKRIIWVVPEADSVQPAAELLSRILGEANVLADRGGLNVDPESDPEVALRLKMLAAENWDSPLTVTAADRFFSSLYGHKPSECRKLHNLANSVIVVEAAGKLPKAQALPCRRALEELERYFKASLIYFGESFKDDIADADGILALTECAPDGGRLPFEQIARSFHLTSERLFTVYERTKENAVLWDEYKNGRISRELMRKLGACSRAVTEEAFLALEGGGKLEIIGEREGILLQSRS